MYICFFVIGIVSNFCSSQSSADGKAIKFISYPFTMKSSHFNFKLHVLVISTSCFPFNTEETPTFKKSNRYFNTNTLFNYHMSC